MDLLKFNPFMPSGLFYHNSLDRSLSNIRGVWLVSLLSCFVEFTVFNANSVDSDQTLCSARLNGLKKTRSVSIGNGCHRYMTKDTGMSIVWQT